MKFLVGLIVLLSAASIFLSGCGVKTSGVVQEDVTLTEEREHLKEAGLDYRGPEYTIAILNFNNKTPSRTLGIGEAATDMMRTLVKSAGLEPIVLSPGELAEQDKLIELQQRGALKEGLKDPAEGFDSVDYRLTGSVTSYTEVAESYDVLVGAAKTVISKVQVDYALVDVATGRALVADSGTGIYKKKTTKIFGFGTKSSADASLRDGALRDALTKALRSMVDKLNNLPYTGRVLLVEDETIVIRAGTKSRLEVGDMLNVYRLGTDLIDPDTGRSLGKRRRKIGEISITSLQNERVSHAEATDGNDFKRGDIITEYR